MKLNNSFSSQNYYSQTNPNNTTMIYGSDVYPMSNTRPLDKRKAISTIRVATTYNNFVNPQGFNTLADPLHSPKIINKDKKSLNKSGYHRDRTHKTIQQVEKECESKLKEEKKRYKEKEKENRQQIKQLVNRIESEKDKRLLDLTAQTELKRKNLDLRKRVSELIYENNSLISSNQVQATQISQLQKQNEGLVSQIQQLQQQLIQMNTKMNKKIVKREARMDEMHDLHQKEIRKLQKEMHQLQAQNKELEFELYSYKKQGQISLQEQSIYEDKIKQLLLDLENSSKKHIIEINGFHESMRELNNKCRDYEDKLKVLMKEHDQALKNERAVRKQNVRLKLQNQELKKQSQRHQSAHKRDNPMRNEDLIQDSEQDKTSSDIDKNYRTNQQRKPKPQQSIQEQEVLSNLADNIQQNSALCNGHIRRMFSLQNILFKGNKLISKNQMMDELSEYDNLIRAMGALFFTSKRMGDQIPSIFQAWKEYSFEMRAKKIRTMLSDSQLKQSQSVKSSNRDGSMRFNNNLGSQGMTIMYDNNQSEDYYDDNDDMNNDEEEFIKVADSNQSYSILPVNQVKPQNNHQDSQYQDGEDEDISIEEDDDEPIEEEKNKKENWDFKDDDPEVQNAKLLEKYAQMQGYNINQYMEGENQQDENEDEDDDQGVIYVDENGREIDAAQLRMMIGKDGLIQGEDGNFYLQEFEEDDDNNEEDLYKDIITADDYINDDEEAKANLLKEKQRLKDKILYQKSTSNEGSAQKRGSKQNPRLNYYEEMGEDGNIYLYEQK